MRSVHAVTGLILEAGWNGLREMVSGDPSGHSVSYRSYGTYRTYQTMEYAQMSLKDQLEYCKGTPAYNNVREAVISLRKALCDRGIGEEDCDCLTCHIITDKFGVLEE